MPLHSTAVGQSIAPTSWTATTRAALAYAAALDANDAGLLRDDADNFAVLPTQIVTPEWAAALQLRNVAALGLTPAEAMRGVHAGQDTRFLKPIPRDRALRTEATIVGARGVRSGAMMTVRYATYDADVLVAETLSRSVYRGVETEGADIDAVSPVHESAIDLTHATPLSLPRGFAHLYSECAAIWNPIHTERRVALMAGLPDIIVHGTALWALAGLALMRHARGQRLSRLACRFVHPLVAGEDATLHFGAEGKRASFEIRNDTGVACVSDGIAEFVP